MTQDADAELLAYRLDPSSNHTAWLVWHSSRVLDRHHANLADVEQIWIRNGWVDRFGLDLDPQDHGYGHTSEQVARVQVSDPTDLRAYHADVDQQVRVTLRSFSADDLDRVIDVRDGVPITCGVRIVSFLDDAIQHLGQAAYLRGLYLQAAAG